jgi:hypothetical protein
MWLTVRLLLIMSILLELETTQINYTAAFVHADIDCLVVYVAMPPGFGIPRQVWKLRKSLYGLAQSPRNYFLYTRYKLIKMGFVQSEADPCLFISSDIICLRLVPSETPCLLGNISLGRTDGTVRAQTVLCLTHPLTRAIA